MLDYEDELRAFQIENHLWIPVERTRANVLVVGCCRPSEPFDEWALVLARLAQRVILALHRHFLVIGEWVDDHPLATGAYVAAEEAHLTPRQVVVLSMVAQGLTARAVGHRLGISGRTVERHLENIYARLGVTDRVTAVRLATLAGVLAVPPIPGARVDLTNVAPDTV